MTPDSRPFRFDVSSAFTICSLWLVSALTEIGEVARARALRLIAPARTSGRIDIKGDPAAAGLGTLANLKSHK